MKAWGQLDRDKEAGGEVEGKDPAYCVHSCPVSSLSPLLLLLPVSPSLDSLLPDDGLGLGVRARRVEKSLLPPVLSQPI